MFNEGNKNYAKIYNITGESTELIELSRDPIQTASFIYRTRKAPRVLMFNSENGIEAEVMYGEVIFCENKYTYYNHLVPLLKSLYNKITEPIKVHIINPVNMENVINISMGTEL